MLDRNNYYVAKAAALVAELALTSLKPDLVEAFERFLTGGAKLDPQCWAKQAIAESLAELGHDDQLVFIKGTQHFQPEPVWGGQQDTAVRLRGVCTLALIQCKISEFELLSRLVDILGDPEKGVRMEAIRAIGQCSSPDASLLLRVKATAGDTETEVTGQCLVTLLDMGADQHIAYVSRFLNASDDIRFEALAALSECRDPRSAQLLIDSIKHAQDIDIKEEMILALGRSRHQVAMDFLLAEIENGRIQNASVCITALARGPSRDSLSEQVTNIVHRRANEILNRLVAKEFNG
ncbi:MAG: HEAT repeat domain-containing protein [Burkholderiales bacterium]